MAFVKSFYLWALVFLSECDMGRVETSIICCKRWYAGGSYAISEEPIVKLTGIFLAGLMSSW